MNDKKEWLRCDYCHKKAMVLTGSQGYFFCSVAHQNAFEERIRTQGAPAPAKQVRHPIDRLWDRFFNTNNDLDYEEGI